MKLILGFALIFYMALFVPNVIAQEIFYDVTVVLSEAQAHETIKITINNTGMVPFDDFSYELPADAANVLVYDSDGPLIFEVVSNLKQVVTAQFREPIQPRKRHVVTIEFDTSQLISSAEEYFVFSARFTPPPGLTKQFYLRIMLPMGMGLSHPISDSAQTDIAPIPDKTFSDGTRTIFEWDVKDRGEFAVFIRYGEFKSAESNNLLLYILVGLILAAILLVFALRSSKRDADDGGAQFMREDERHIIDLIKENEGIVQKRIADKTGFSKAKVSKIISDLEKRDIVSTEKIGRRKKLFLTEKFKKG